MKILFRVKGFPKLGVPFWGVPIIRTMVCWGLYWCPLILGNYHIGLCISITISCPQKDRTSAATPDRTDPPRTLGSFATSL